MNVTVSETRAKSLLRDLAIKVASLEVYSARMEVEAHKLANEGFEKKSTLGKIWGCGFRYKTASDMSKRSCQLPEYSRNAIDSYIDLHGDWNDWPYTHWQTRYQIEQITEMIEELRSCVSIGEPLTLSGEEAVAISGWLGMDSLPT